MKKKYKLLVIIKVMTSALTILIVNVLMVICGIWMLVMVVEIYTNQWKLFHALNVTQMHG